MWPMLSRFRRYRIPCLLPPMSRCGKGPATESSNVMAPPEPKSVLFALKLLSLNGVNQSTRDSPPDVCSLTKLSPNSVTPSYVPLLVMTYIFPLLSTVGAAPAIQIPPPSELGVAQKAPVTASVLASCPITHPCQGVMSPCDAQAV